MGEVSDGDNRRLMLLGITPELVMLFGSGKFEVIAHPLPDDVRRVGAFYDAQTDCFAVVMESAEFPEVTLGQRIPYHEAPCIRRLEE